MAVLTTGAAMLAALHLAMFYRGARKNGVKA
jgi:hypothetical protein